MSLANQRRLPTFHFAPFGLRIPSFCVKDDPPVGDYWFAYIRRAGVAKLFLSYRRLDTGAYAGRLAERLRAFQFESVFYDREGIVLGANYADEIRSALGGCDAVLAERMPPQPRGTFS